MVYFADRIWVTGQNHCVALVFCAFAGVVLCCSSHLLHTSIHTMATALDEVQLWAFGSLPG